MGVADSKQKDCSKYHLRTDVNLDFGKRAHEKGERHLERSPGMLSQNIHSFLQGK